MEAHTLVAFYRGRSQADRDKAISALSEEEYALQARLSEENDSGGQYITDDVVVVLAPEQAEGVTSVSHIDEDGKVWHRPVLDIDFGAALIPSSTPGHFHLYLDKIMDWEAYSALLYVLAECGVIEPGYDRASQERGYSSARLPTKPKVPVVVPPKREGDPF